MASAGCVQTCTVLDPNVSSSSVHLRQHKWHSLRDRERQVSRGKSQRGHQTNRPIRWQWCPSQTRRGARQHATSLRRRVMDGAHRLINQTVKRQDAEKGIGSVVARAPGWRERRVRNEEADARTQRKAERDRAWPNLARLMKNGQESAYLACPSLPCASAPPHFLLIFTPTPSRPFCTLNALYSLSWIPGCVLHEHTAQSPSRRLISLGLFYCKLPIEMFEPVFLLHVDTFCP